MSENPLRNPYNPLRPTTDPAMFFGRDEAFTLIRQRLVGGRRPQAIGIIGQRGMGKTSTLLQVRNQIEARYITAYIDLSEVHFEEVGGLFVAMADAARLAFDSAGLSTYRLPPIPEAEGAEVDLWQWFSETYLEVTLSALRNNRRLLFLFDETTKLLDAIDRRDIAADFDATLSSLIARDERLDIIFALDAEDEHRLETFIPLSDPLLHTRLGLLDSESAERLTRRPSSAYYDVQVDALETITGLTGGHPYLLHVVNALIWERAMSRQEPGPITLNDVKAVVAQATAEADPVLHQIWTHSTPNERQALLALTALTTTNHGQPVLADDIRSWLLRESEAPLDETSLASALRRLEYREVLRTPLKGQKNTYVFASELLHQWLTLKGDIQPTPSLSRLERPASRRFAIPAVLLLVFAIAAALWLGKIATSDAPDAPVPPTVTLQHNFVATQQALDATQTALAAPRDTSTPTVTFTSSPIVLNLSSPGVPTSVVATIVIPPTNTQTPIPTLTFTSSFTPTVTPTFTITYTPSPLPPTATFTATPLVTAPPFPTGQVRAPTPGNSP
ncbi:MAG TPA: ATP-binding protein [Aggregatilineales bacterium]|nr:ATP-binding protein [Aggregatilineales bacterium]